jgi:uncharacterized OB-fold protein
MTSTIEDETRARRPVRVGLLTEPLNDIASVRLVGSRCSTCGETSLGPAEICPNCGQATIAHTALAPRGLLWSFTVVRHKPPGDYHGPDPFVPFALGLVELPEGVRVLTPVIGPPDSLEIGMAMDLKVYVRPDEVVAFGFEPVSSRGLHD